MAKKTKEEKPARAMTKRQLSHHRKETRRQRIFTITGISVVAVVIVLVAVGWFLGEYRPAHAIALKINDTEFTSGYFVDVLREFHNNQPEASLEDNISDIITEIARNEIVRQGALQLGIQVSDEEVEQALEDAEVNLGPAVLDLARAQLLMDKIVTQYFQPQVPESQPQVNMRAMLLETEAEAVEMRNRLTTTDNFSALAGEHSLDYYSKINSGDIGWHPESVLPYLLGSDVPGAYAFGSEAGILSQPRYDAEKAKPSGYWLLEVLEREYTDEAQVRGLLLSTEAEAADIRARLVAGDNVTALAAEFSQYEESRKQGGELGVVTKGDLTDAVDEYIFKPDVEIGEWSQPLRDEEVYTGGAWWLIEVLEKDDDRTLAQEDLDYLTSELVNAWLQTLLQSQAENVEDFLDVERVDWILKRAMNG